MASISPEPSVGLSVEASFELSVGSLVGLLVESLVELSVEPSIELITAASAVPSPLPAIIEHLEPPERIIDPAKGTFIRYSSLA